MESFNSHFENKYREHVFLSHDKVPNAIKSSVSRKIHLSRYLKQQDTSTSNVSAKDSHELLGEMKEYTQNTISTSDILIRFGRGSSLNEFSVLDFDTLNIQIDHNNPFWTQILKKAIRIANYRQVGKLSYTKSS